MCCVCVLPYETCQLSISFGRRIQVRLWVPTTLPCLNLNARSLIKQQQFPSAPLGEYSWLEVVKSGAWRLVYISYLF